MTFTIRNATTQDAAAIARVQVASWRSTYPGLVPSRYLENLDIDSRERQWTLRLERGIGVYLVAEDDSGLFGFISGGTGRRRIVGYDSEIYSLYLLEEKQGRGIGRALVREFARRMEMEGYQSVAVWVLAGNPSRGFYEELSGLLIARDEIEIGGELLYQVAYGWPSINELAQLADL